MSAIWGIISWDAPLPQNIKEQMQLPFQKKCKIDRYSSVQKDTVFMGCGIQYLTDESLSEVLPYTSGSPDFFMTADCLLDNRKELLSLLQLPASTPDGTVMAQAYSRFGISCLKYFRGLFSLAVYDFAKKTLYLAADQMASRCLYYYESGRQVSFSTLSSAILQAFPEIPENPLFFKDFLTAPGLAPNISPEDTPYRGMYKLKPGTCLEITSHGITEHTYWTPADEASPFSCGSFSAARYGRSFRQLYSDCVRDALRCNGEVGICLSSGLDSASVGTLAATHLQQGHRNLYAYTYVPYETPHPDKNRDHVTDETADVQKILDMYPNMKPHFLNNHGKNCLEALQEELEIMEIPFKAYANLPNLMEIYEEASAAGCKVLLTGQAGNSTVSYGYIDNILCHVYHRKHYMTFLYWLNRYAKHVKESRRSALKSCIRYYNAAARQQNLPDTVPGSKTDNPFVNSEILTDYPMAARHTKYAPTRTPGFPMTEKDYRSWVWFAPFLTYIGELETKMGLHYGLILRDPTRDSRMVNFCYHLPYEIFAWQGTPRWLIRGNFRDLLPTDLLDRWMRYGVQNSDYYLRIQRDWQKLLPDLEKELEASPGNYCSKDTVQAFLVHYRTRLPDEVQDEFMYLCFVYILQKYLKIYHFC